MCRWFKKMIFLKIGTYIYIILFLRIMPERWQRDAGPYSLMYASSQNWPVFFAIINSVSYYPPFYKRNFIKAQNLLEKNGQNSDFSNIVMHDVELQ
jgi:hypothetical protein